MKAIVNILSALSVLALSAASPALAKKEPLYLKPSSKWVVSYDETKCRLIRDFGKDKNLSTLLFERVRLSEEYQMSFGGKPFLILSPSAKIKLQFGPNDDVRDKTFLKGHFDTRRKIPSIIQASQSELKTDVESAGNKSDTNYISFISGLRKPVVLETGPMKGALTAMDKCIENLVTSWGLDFQTQKSLTKRVSPLIDPDRWLGPKDYPTDMLHRGQPALVDFRLNVDTQGVPSSCHIQSTTRPKDFDDAVCKAIMRHAKFSPALDKNGEKVASFYLSRVRFTFAGT